MENEKIGGVGIQANPESDIQREAGTPQSSDLGIKVEVTDGD